MKLVAGTTLAATLALAALWPAAATAQGAPQTAPTPAAATGPVLPQVVKSAKEFTGDYKPPRDNFGHPQLFGFWTNASVSRMERPSGYPLIISDEQAANLEGRALFNVRLKTEKDFVDPKTGAPEKGKALPGVGNYDVAYTDPGAAVATIKGEKRSSYLTFPESGHVPEMTAEGKAMRAAMPRRAGTGYDNPEERGNSERCIIIGTNGPPFGNYLYNNNFEIVQTGDNVVIMSEMIHDVRIAKINGQHRKDDVTPWMGDSIAWWDGDTLVVETKSLDPRSGGAFISKDGKVTERFTRISDKQILYEFEVNDPKVYTSVYRGQMPLTMLDDRVYEYACHEGNYALEHILSGGRTDDRQGVVHTGGGSRGE